ncbi:HAD hydrolase family protein, partial [Bacillus sp. PPSBB_11]
AAAQYSFAVRNATQEVKDAAHFITLSNEESGVMHTIQKILSLQTSS